MLQVLSNTEVITDWFLTAIRSYPLADCPMNSATHALIQKFSPSTYKAHKLCILYQEKRKKPPNFLPSAGRIVQGGGVGERASSFQLCYSPRIEIAGQTEKYCLYLSNHIKYTYCHLPCH